MLERSPSHFLHRYCEPQACPEFCTPQMVELISSISVSRHLCLRERECGLRATHSWSPCTQVRIDIYDIRAAFETVGGMLRNTGGVFAFPSPVGKPFIIAKDEAFLRDVSRVKTPWQCTRTTVRALTRTARC